MKWLEVQRIKSGAEFRQMATDCAMAKRAEKKAQASRDKESGLCLDKAQARDKLKAQVLDAEKEFVRSVATAQGWNEGVLKPEIPAGLSESAVDK